MAGEIVFHGLPKSFGVTALAKVSVFIDDAKIADVKRTETITIPFEKACKLSIRCGANRSRPQIEIPDKMIVEVQCTFSSLSGKFKLEIISKHPHSSCSGEDRARIEQELEREKVALQEEQAKKTREHRMRCNVCGNIFCYTQQDIDDNVNNILVSALSTIGSMAGALGGSRYDMYEQNKNADSYSAKVKDFSRCPKCNSTNLSELTDEDCVHDKAEYPEKNRSVASELKEFKELLDMGAITQEEFDEKKKQLLGL